MVVHKRGWLDLFTRALGVALLLAACVGPALTAGAAQSPTVLRMARNAEPGLFVPWLIDDNTPCSRLATCTTGYSV